MQIHLRASAWAAAIHRPRVRLSAARRRMAQRGDLAQLTCWPAGSRLIRRKERPHPGPQLALTNIDGMRITPLLTQPPAGVVPGQLAW
jgi:hypothetical protein